MAAYSTIKKTGRSLGSKLIIALLLGCLAIAVSWAVTKLTFSKILGTVHQLSAPNPKLQLVNSIFKDVVTLDQMQRAQALKGKPAAYNPFFKESKQLRERLDSLRLFSNGNDLQLVRIDSMKQILRLRDKVFLSYLSLRNDFIRNDTLAMQIRSLSEMITDEGNNTDSSIVTTEKKITRTTIEDVDTTVKEEKQSFWDRLINRKKAPEVTKVRQLIQEELNIKIDTLAHARADSLVQELSNAITVAESERSNKRNVLVNRQVQLNRSGNQLISQLMGILQDIETEELHSTQLSNIQATEVVNTGLTRMNMVLVVFIICVAFLAFLIFVDIAKSNRYKKELIKAKENAEELGQMKQRFLSNMSHELRTPLQAIVGVAEQVKMNKTANSQDIDTIYHSSQHLLQTVNEVLDYNRIVSDKFVLDNKPFNIKQLLDEVVDSLRINVSEKGLKFKYEVDIDASQNHLGDPFRLRQILYNLLGNAIKFTDTGTVSLTVSHTDVVNADQFRFNISDTGSGIAEQDMERIFNQFEQGSDPKHQQKGTGLGLSIVKSLVNVQGGSLDVTSQVGQGSLFTVILTFPRTQLVDARAVMSLKAPSIKGTVLIVDDDAFILQLCSAIMSKYNIHHVCYESSVAALQNVGNDISIALLDIRMPVLNGIELCRELKHTLKQEIAFIALTAQALPGEKEQILSSGFDEVLMKPFMEKDLLSALNQYADIEDNKHEWADDLQEDIDIEILESYIRETGKDLLSLETAMSNERPLEVAEYLHRLAGRCSQMGDVSYSLRLRAIERSIRKDKVMADKTSLIQLCDDLYQVININRQQLARFT